ncbi:hypothetical protein LOB94_08315 [Lactobacillus delbrueckii subsp. bulgaricus]|nr:hypothetical protein [Lactobacillus delbrueckii subsp. bulgaricus]
MLEAQSFTTDFLRVNFTEFLSIFYFSFLLLISVLSSYKKSVRIAADSLASLSNDQVQGFWLNDQMILRCFLLFTIKTFHHQDSLQQALLLCILSPVSLLHLCS